MHKADINKLTREYPRGVVANGLDCNIIVNEFELHSGVSSWSNG